MTTLASDSLALCDLADIPAGSVRPATAGRVQLTVVNAAGTIRVFVGGCPHHGGPLQLGTLKPRVVSTPDGERTLDPDHPVLMCPWHNFEFDVESGCALFDKRLRLRTIPHQIQDGKVCVQWPPSK